jgi:hypothetical protein
MSRSIRCSNPRVLAYKMPVNKPVSPLVSSVILQKRRADVAVRQTITTSTQQTTLQHEDASSGLSIQKPAISDILPADDVLHMLFNTKKISLESSAFKQIVQTVVNASGNTLDSDALLLSDKILASKVLFLNVSITSTMSRLYSIWLLLYSLVAQDDFKALTMIGVTLARHSPCK